MSSGTPQQNGVVESVFATIYSHMRAMMVHTGINENLKTSLWP